MLSFVAKNARRGACSTALSGRAGIIREDIRGTSVACHPLTMPTTRRQFSLFDVLATKRKTSARTNRDKSQRQQRPSLFDVLKQQSKKTEKEASPDVAKETSSVAEMKQIVQQPQTQKSQPNAGSDGNMITSQASKARSGGGKLSSLEKLQQQVQELHQLSSKIEPTSPFSLVEVRTEDAEEREEIFRKTKILMSGLEQAVRQGQINPSGKHGHTVSSILGIILNFYSTSHPTNQSAFDECNRVLAFLDHWNLDRQAPHYQYSILAAVHEQRWQEASDLFLQQIDLEVSGFFPVKVSVSSPFGLYAVSRAAQDKGAAVVEPVLDAVTSLHLISPTEQDQHILAAGTALGLAGEWEGLVSYLENSINATNMGQSLVAATMHACILCNQHDAALQVFQTLLEGHLPISSEFHWGGGEHQILPLCRDLAMRACANTIQEGYSPLAMDLLGQSLQSELSISAEALEGVLGACERDKNWKDAMEVLFQCISSDNNLWIVPGSSLHIPTIGDLAEANKLKRDTALVDRGRIVSLVMRACIASNKCGTALLCQILAEASPPGSVLFAEEGTHAAVDEHESCGYIEQTLLPLITEVRNPDELLSAATAALCGVSCFEQACSLFHTTKERMGDAVDLVDAEFIQQFAHSFDTSSTEKGGWHSAHRHIHRICTALEAVKIKGEMLDQGQLQLLSSAFASALRACTHAEQAEVGILLGEHIQAELSRLTSSASGDSHFVIGRSATEVSDHGLVLNDTMLAEQMSALGATGQPDVALSLLESAVNVDEWSQTCNMAIKLLLRNEEHEKALLLCQELVKSTDNIDSFVAAAEGFAAAERWSDVADTYHIALKKGCLSQKLCLLAMKAVVEVNMPGRLRLLRGIIHDAGRAVGQSAVDWLDSNYWTVKQAIGFDLARLLMWWNDPSTCHLDELQYAIDVFEKRLEDGLQAKNVTLRLIVTHARHFREEDFPREKKEISRVPRDRESWVKLLARVLQESANLKNNGKFIDDCAAALRNLGCYVECVNFVKDAVQRGFAVRPQALNEALLAANAAGLQDETGEIKLALFNHSS